MAQVAPVFAHEPTVSRAPTGEYVMYYTTNYGEQPGSQCNPPCVCGHNGTSCLQCPNDQQCHAKPRSPLSTRMSWANTTDGPWSKPVLVPSPTQGDTNCACVIRRNSSLVCMGRPGLGSASSAASLTAALLVPNQQSVPVSEQWPSRTLPHMRAGSGLLCSAARRPLERSQHVSAMGSASWGWYSRGGNA
eukprot:SAG25_NODE_1333_length_3276_cov_3.560277_2_plen_190_part_00